MADQYSLESNRFNIDDQKQRLYPKVPNPPLPWPLPPQACEGTYTNPGYDQLKLRLVENNHVGNELSGVILQTTSAMGFDGLTYHIDLHHVSGNFWLGLSFVEEHLPKCGRYNAHPELCLRVEFQLGVEGQVHQLGLDLRQESFDGPLVWFTKEQSQS